MTAKQKQRNKQKTVENVSLSWDDNAWEDYQYWLKTSPEIFSKVNDLINESLKTPFSGTGKPEFLKKENLSGFISRRITKEHRLVYMYEKGVLHIASCRYHYDD